MPYGEGSYSQGLDNGCLMVKGSYSQGLDNGCLMVKGSYSQGLDNGLMVFLSINNFFQMLLSVFSECFGTTKFKAVRFKAFKSLSAFE